MSKIKRVEVHELILKVKILPVMELRRPLHIKMGLQYASPNMLSSSSPKMVAGENMLPTGSPTSQRLDKPLSLRLA